MSKHELATLLIDGGPDSDLFGTWAMLPGDATDEQAREAFRRRFGAWPERIVREGDELLVGPVPEEVGDSDLVQMALALDSITRACWELREAVTRKCRSRGTLGIEQIG
ncbi:MAG TPA: hypothetical protein GX714_04060 [Chloroflexi bacterium]|jgi:hypothetical protein|nr:hypothetical protein [Chloroflexota bacterium]